MTHDPREALAQIRAVCIDNADVERKDLALRFILNVAEQALTSSAPKGEPVAWRWKPKCAELWIYNPDAAWVAEHKDDINTIDIEPLYTSPPPAAGWDGSRNHD